MNDLSQKAIIALLLILTMVAYIIAGSEDYDQRTIEAMPDEIYREIVDNLGPGCTNRKVVAEYKSNRSHYDSIKYIPNE